MKNCISYLDGVISEKSKYKRTSGDRVTHIVCTFYPNLPVSHFQVGVAQFIDDIPFPNGDERETAAVYVACFSLADLARCHQKGEEIGWTAATYFTFEVGKLKVPFTPEYSCYPEARHCHVVVWQDLDTFEADQEPLEDTDPLQRSAKKKASKVRRCISMVEKRNMTPVDHALLVTGHPMFTINCIVPISAWLDIFHSSKSLDAADVLVCRGTPGSLIATCAYTGTSVVHVVTTAGEASRLRGDLLKALPILDKVQNIDWKNLPLPSLVCQ